MSGWMKRWHVGAMALMMLLAASATHAVDKRVYGAGKGANRSRAQAVVAPAAAAAEDPLQAFETRRQQLRARQRAQLNELIHDDATDEESLREARRQLLEDMEAEQREETLQGILRARGFDGAVVSARNGAANILVRSEGLNRRETAVILELVLRETGITGGNVKIIPIN